MGSLKSLADKPWKAFGAFTPGQKAVTIVAVLVLVVGGLMFSRWTSTTTMVPLYASLSSEDAAAITAKLEETGTEFELADGGSSIMVPREQRNALHLQMAGEGLPADTDEGGYAVLEGISPTAPKFMQDMAAKQALEGELAKSLQAIDGVDTALVQVAVPEKDVFASEDEKPTASVVVQTEAGVELSSGQVRAMGHLVASSVQGMTPESVTITDAGSGKLLSSPAGEDGAGAGGDIRSEMTQAYEDKLSERIETILAPMVGSGGSVVSVTADLDYDSTKSITKNYVAPEEGALPLSASTSEETYTGTGGAVSGVLGPDNVGVDAEADGNDSEYNKNNSVVDNAYGTVEETRVKAPGDVRTLSIAVAVDNGRDVTRTLDPLEVENLVSRAAGLNAERGDTVQVSMLQFDDSAATEAQEEIAAAKAAEEQAAMMGYARTAGLLVLVLFIMLLTWLKSRKHKKKVPLSKADLERIEELERINAELEAEKAALALQSGATALAITSGSDSDPEGEEFIRMRDEIGDLVEQQPEEVAQLLRGWLADRRS